MDIRVDRNEFLTELAPMAGIVERKTTIPVLSHLLLAAGDDRLRLSATDLDVSLTSWVKADVATPGSLAVQAKKFMEIIRAVGDEEVHLEQEEPEWLTVTAGASRFKIHGMPADDFPQLPEISEEYGIEIPFEDLKKMIGKVLFAVSAEESRFQLNGALLKLKDGGLEMVATDGHRLALAESPLDAGGREDSVLVPRKALQELQRFEGAGALGYSRGEHHLSFRLGRRELTCRILEGTFPDYQRVIARDNDKRATFDRRSLDVAVQRAALMTGDRARAVRLDFANDELVLTAANPDLGEAVERVPCEYSGPELKLGLNPDYLRDFLAAVESPRVLLECKDENTQCVGHPLGAEDAGEGPVERGDGGEGGQAGSRERYLCVIMPMRV